MRGKPTRERRRIQLLHDLANDGGFVALKWAAEDREGWRQRKDVNNLLHSGRLLMMMMRRRTTTMKFGQTV